MNNKFNNHHIQLEQIYTLKETVNKKRKQRYFADLLSYVDKIQQQENVLSNQQIYQQFELLLTPDTNKGFKNFNQIINTYLIYMFYYNISHTNFFTQISHASAQISHFYYLLKKKTIKKHKK